MTGLIWKDFYVMHKAMKSYLFIMVAYFVLAYMEFLQFEFIVTFIQMVLMVLPISAFAYDEQAKWDRYAFSLPVGRGAVVGARYLFVLGLALFTAAIGVVSTIILWKLGKSDPMEMILTVMVSSTIGLLVPAILLPLCYKLGAERARPYLYAIIFIPVIAVLLLSKANMLDFSVLNRLNNLSNAALLGAFSLLPLGGLAALLVSYLISCRVVAGKEY